MKFSAELGGFVHFEIDGTAFGANGEHFINDRCQDSGGVPGVRLVIARGFSTVIVAPPRERSKFLRVKCSRCLEAAVLTRVRSMTRIGLQYSRVLCEFEMCRLNFAVCLHARKGHSQTQQLNRWGANSCLHATAVHRQTQQNRTRQFPFC